jgi:uncharacterized membrane protein YhhN
MSQVNYVCITRYFSWLYWLLALGYLGMLHIPEYPLDYLHKASPILLLFLLVYLKLSTKSPLVLMALLLSATGDVLLALPIEHSFTLGLAAFLTAHCCYVMLFLRWRYWRFSHLFILVPLTILVTVMGYVIIPHSGALAPAVTAYLLIIYGMACCAAITTKGDYTLLFGAVLFIISDSLIAVNKFVTSLPFEGVLIMLSYYFAQYLLVMGVLKRIVDDNHS